MRESDIERAICSYAKTLGITAEKFNGPGNRGKADRIFMKNGVTAFLEIKAPGKFPTALQLRYLKQRQQDGFASDWCDNTADGIKFLQDTFLK